MMGVATHSRWGATYTFDDPDLGVALVVDLDVVRCAPGLATVESPES